jgi:hypothetical protein
MIPFLGGLFDARQTVGGMPIPELQERVNHVEAFSNGIANQIKERDNHTCRCGRSQFDGWHIDASHKDHNKKNPYYNSESNGQTECKIHHLETHLKILTNIWRGESGENEHWAMASIKMLANGMWFQGLNGYRPVSFEDRQEINRMFEYYGVEISDYIDISKQEY